MVKNGIITSRYVDLKSDVAFKRIFGSDKQMTLGLINAIIKDHTVVQIQNIRVPRQNNMVSESNAKTQKRLQNESTLFKDLDFAAQEKISSLVNKRVILDLVCTTDTGDTIIIEMQRASYKDFHARALLYAAFELHNQHKANSFKYKITPIYFIGLLNFKLTKDSGYVNEYTIFNKDTGNSYPDNPLHFIFIEFPKFTLREKECKDRLSKIIYSFKHSSKLKNMPKSFKNDEFIEKIYNFAEVENLNEVEKRNYIEYIMGERRINVLLESAQRHALEEGMEKGLKQGAKQEKLRTAKNFLLAGVPIDVVIQCTGLTRRQVLALQN